MGEPYWGSENGDVVLHLGKCEKVLPDLPANSLDAVVCDPPYDLTSGKKGGTGPASLNEAHPAGRSRITTGGGFMGRGWDATGVAFDPATWRAVLRVLKPGGYLLAFGGTRTWHRMVCAIEDAGFEIRDPVADLTGIDGPGLLWFQGQGFPKSRDVSKDLDKRRDWDALAAFQAMLKAARLKLGISQSEAARRIGMIGPGESLGGGGFMWFETGLRIPTPEQYAALKTCLGLDDSCDAAFEAAEREVLSETIATRHGGSWAEQVKSGMFQVGDRLVQVTAPATEAARQWDGWGTALKPAWEPIAVGRKPLAGTAAANVLAHGTGLLNIDACRIHTPDSEAKDGRWPPNVVLGETAAAELDRQSDSSGGASRYFPVFKYEPKAPAHERPRLPDGSAWPTVKPLDLMCWLVRLVTPPAGLVLDPFAGSGTTAEACIVEGFRCVLVEKDPLAAELIKTRLRKSIQPVMFGPGDSVPTAPVRPVAASKPKSVPEVHASLFDDLESAS